MSQPKCSKCGDTGVWETGNNDLPCDCPAGRTAKFNIAGVDGPVTGDEVQRHFLNGSPEPINRSGVKASELPGRRLCYYDPMNDEQKLFTFSEWVVLMMASIEEYRSAFQPDPNTWHKQPHTFNEWLGSFGRWLSW